MPFDPSKPFAVVGQPKGFDPAKPFKVDNVGLTDEAQSFVSRVRGDNRLTEDQQQEVEDAFRTAYQAAAKDDPSLGSRFAAHFKKGWLEESGLGSLYRLATTTSEFTSVEALDARRSALDAEIARQRGRTTEAVDNEFVPRYRGRPLPELMAERRAIEALGPQEGEREEYATRYNADVLRDYLERGTRVAGYEGMPDAEGVLERGAAAVGRVAGGAASPETLVPVARGGSFLARAVKQGAANVGLGLVAEPVIQAADVAEGRQDRIDTERAAIGALFNAAAGVGFESIATAAQKAVSRFRARPPAERTGETLRSLVKEEVETAAASAPEPERAAATEFQRRLDEGLGIGREAPSARESAQAFEADTIGAPRKSAKESADAIIANQAAEEVAEETAEDALRSRMSPQARRMYDRYGGVDPSVMLAIGAAPIRGAVGGAIGYSIGDTPEEKLELATFGAIGGALASRKLARAVARRLGFKDAPELAPLTEVQIGGRVRSGGEVFTVNRRLEDGGIEVLDANNTPLVIPKDRTSAAFEVVTGVDRRAERAAPKLKGKADDAAIKDAAAVIARDALPSGEAPTPEAVKAAVAAKFGEVKPGIMSRIVAGVREYFAGRFDVNAPEVFDAAKPADKATVTKLAAELRHAKRLVGKTEKLQHQERQKRAARLNRTFDSMSGEAAFNAGKKALLGELPRADFEAIAGRFSEAEIDSLFDHIRTHRSLKGKPHTRERAGMVLQAAMRHGALPARGDIVLLEQLFGPSVASAILGKRPPLRRALDAFAELLNIPRTILSSFDLSAPLRQGFSLTVSHPKLAARAMGAQLRAFVNRDYAVSIDRALRSGPEAKVRESAGLELPSVEGFATEMGQREEAFMSRLLQRVGHITAKTATGRALLAPFKFQARGIAASERAYVTYLNRMRADVFDLVDRQLQEAGLPEEILHAERAKLGKFINAATGRGNVKSNEWMNALFFSPKFLVSRFEAPMRQAANAIGGKGPLRKEAIRELSAQAATWTALWTMGAVAAEAFDWDVKFGADPRSDDFLKYTLDDKTTVDFGGGYGQAARLMARLATGESVNSTTGRESRVQVAPEVGRFLRYKLAPAPSAIVSAIEGKTVSGEKATVGQIASDLTLPISFQTLEEVTNEHGATGLILMIPEVLGAGVNVRQPKPNESGSMFAR